MLVQRKYQSCQHISVIKFLQQSPSWAAGKPGCMDRCQASSRYVVYMSGWVFLTRFLQLRLFRPASNFPLFWANMMSSSSIRLIGADCVKASHKIWHEVNTLSNKIKSFVVYPKQGDPATAGEDQWGNMTPFGAKS